MIRSILRVALLSGGLFVGCTCVSLAHQRYNDRNIATRILPLPIEYARWWQKTEECSGIKKPMRVSFYAIPKSQFRLDSISGLHFLGLYDADTNHQTGQIREKVYLAAPWVYTEWLVRHEMLHAILQRDSTISGHPEEYFMVKCRLQHIQQARWGPEPYPPHAPHYGPTVLPIPQQPNHVLSQPLF